MDFESMWKEEDEEEKEKQEEEIPPDYLIKDGFAKYKLLTDITAFYFHAKHGEPLKKVFPPTGEELNQNIEFEFHL